jgi:hypothetical protein
VIGEIGERPAEVASQGMTGVDALGVRAAVDVHHEPVAAGVDVAGEGSVVALGVGAAPIRLGASGGGG